MVEPTQSINKEIFGHWAVISTILLIAAIIISIIKISPKTPKKLGQTNPVSYIELTSASQQNDIPIPAIMQQNIDMEVAQEILILDRELTYALENTQR